MSVVESFKALRIQRLLGKSTHEVDQLKAATQHQIISGNLLGRQYSASSGISKTSFRVPQEFLDNPINAQPDDIRECEIAHFSFLHLSIGVSR